MIILLNGGPRAGKTTVAKVLANRLGYRMVQLTDPFETFVKSVLNLTDAEFEYYKDRENFKGSTNLSGHTIRKAMIDIANTMEKFDPAIWAKACMKHGGLDLSKDYVVDQIGKPSQMAWVIKTWEPDLLKLVKVEAEGVSVSTEGRYDDGRYSMTRHDAQEVPITVIRNHPVGSRNAETLANFQDMVEGSSWAARN